MEARMRICDVDELELELTIVMPLRDWKKLRELCNRHDEWPSPKLREVIKRAVDQISQSVIADAPPSNGT